MGILRIDCYCNEKQMENIVELVIYHLNNTNSSEIPDFDNIIYNIRVYVKFESYLEKVSIINSEILDSNWELLYEDTAVLTSRLNSFIKSYTKDKKQAVYQAHHILKDQKSNL